MHSLHMHLQACRSQTSVSFLVGTQAGFLASLYPARTWLSLTTSYCWLLGNTGMQYVGVIFCCPHKILYVNVIPIIGNICLWSLMNTRKTVLPSVQESWSQSEKAFSTGAPVKLPFGFRMNHETGFLVGGCYMGGCQNYGPFLGNLNIRCRIITGIQKRGHNFDNHPHTTNKRSALEVWGNVNANTHDVFFILCGASSFARPALHATCIYRQSTVPSF